MTQLTPSQQTIVRSTDQYSDLYLGVYIPPIVFEATINNASISKGSVSIPYNNVITGSFNNVVVGMTLYIGSTPDGDDIGRVRVRAITSSIVTVAIDNRINYQNGQYITIRDFHEIWSVFPRATLSSQNKVSYFKDYDVPYTDQNSIFRPTAILGSNYFGFANDTLLSGTKYNAVYFTATGSYCVDGGVISAFSWQFPTGSVPYTYNTGTPGYVTFPRDGFFSVSCQVSGNGKTDTGYRHVALFNRPGSSNKNLPINDWVLQDVTANWQGGATAKIDVGVGADTLKDGYMVGIWCDDYYNGTRQSFGHYPGRESILFVGYVNRADTTYNPYNSTTTFYLNGVLSELSNKQMFSVSLANTQNPSSWTQLKNMNIPKALDHYLRWHTTVLEVADFININTTEGTYAQQYEDVLKGELLTNVNDMLSKRLFGNLCSDIQGRLFAEIDMNMQPTGSRPVEVFTFQDKDWINDPKFTEIIDIPLSDILLGGVAYDISHNSGTAYLSRAPGAFPTYQGKSVTISSLTLASQDQLNTLSGLYFGQQNNRINNFTQDLAFNMRSIDVCPQEFYIRNISITDTFRKIVLNNKRFLPRKISFKYKNGSLVQNTTWEAESNAPQGDTIIIPAITPVAAAPAYIPPVSIPPIQPGTSTIYTSGDGNVVYVVTTTKIGRSRNFLSSSPNWSDITGVIDTTNNGKMVDFVLDPFDPKNTAYVLCSDVNTNLNVYKTSNLNDTSPLWTLVLTNATAKTLVGASSFINGFRIKATIVSQNVFYVTCFSNGNAGLYVLKTINGGITWTASNVATSIHSDTYGFDVSQHLANGTIIVCCQNGSSQGLVYRSTDGGSSWSLAANLNSLSIQRICDVLIPYNNNPTDRTIYLVGNANSTGTYKLLKSTDNGSTWTDVSPIGFSTSPTIGSAPGQPSQNFRCINSFTQGITSLLISNGELIFSSASGESGLVQINSFTNASVLGSTGRAGTALGGFPYNQNVYEALWDSPTANSPLIIASADFGVTWTDKTGDWISVVGARATTFIHGIVIVPLWVG